VSGAAVVRRGRVEVFLDGPTLEPPPELRARVDELWERERQARPSLVDGTILSVSEIEGARVTVRACPYRLFVARERDEDVRSALGLRALGVSGVLLVGPDGAPSVVFGRRARDVTEYGGAWELVPSGGLDAARAGPDGSVDVGGALLAELEEEAGVSRDAVAETLPLGLVHDLAQDGYDVCFALRLRDEPRDGLPEYEETELVPGGEAAAWLDDAGRAVVPTSRAILDLAREAGLL
jgi:hypothetical protein